ncbi:zinc finger BED domain-containing protein RICESLEEPER 2-like [Rhizophagus clarus]|uniref:Zinc finger BED domain-containing protein RICESLEEPER 2-like n=1 Tax=Rhizophagus clarus TaxID=94130 RepID=A0A8H3QNS7_9GLOM|nr:zinc finger BED domain-containing protein RICESLEEPER 2-like [Rhizophagus clarus]
MMHIFDPYYKIPDRHQIKEIIIDEFNERRSNIGYDLQKISSKVSFTADMWTSTISSEAYLGLTIHYIDQNWVFRRFLLDIISFKVRYIGINMVAAITNILNEFNLVGKALALTTDNESAMLVCGRKLSKEFEKELNNLTFSHYCCSAYILNLAVKQGMEIVDQEIVEVRQLMSKIKNSVLFCDELRELYVIEKLEYLWPEINIEMRWNSTYYMLCELTTNAIAILREQFSFYLFQKPQSQASLPSTSSREYFRQLKKCRIGVTAETTLPPSPSPDLAEIERYLALPCDKNVEVLLWWQAHSTEFPVLSLMAKDYLAIQSTSVACEQAFSVAGNTITKVRNRLCLETARASLCTKSWIENNIGEQIRLK